MAEARIWGWGLAAAGVALALALAWPGTAPAAKKSDVRQSKHNLSATYPVTPDPRDVKSAETQVCAFCHTPHGARTDVMPLWNRQDSGATYTTYSSSTYDAQNITAEFQATPAGSSKLCLSCHDGTIALGQVNVLNGAARTVTMTITGGGQTMPGGTGTNPDGSPKGAQSGYTRLLGTDLRNDHPISVSFSNTLVARDGELRNVTAIQAGGGGINTGQRDTDTTGTTIGVKSLGYKPHAPLEATGPAASGTNFGQVQCASCHDPHMIETDLVNAGNNKFLRQNLNRFQGPPGGANQGPDAAGNFLASRDIICIACHKKEGWPGSAHASPTLGGDVTYIAAAATLREFPTGTTFRMWNAACLNCHDTHTVQGAVRLARDGTDGGANGVSPKQGGNRATEQTCYQCHQAAAGSAIASLPGRLDVMTDFVSGTTRMPINDNPEIHDIGGARNESGQGGVDCTTATNRCGKDFVESRLLLGFDTTTQQSVPSDANRHVECTDCHNPHRVLRNSRYDGAGVNTQATHQHTTGIHTNIASGTLAGTFGVEITAWTSPLFGGIPSAFTPLCGQPGSPATAACSGGPVTKEYQICIKCHSNYAYADIDGTTNTATWNYVGRPLMGGAGLTPVRQTILQGTNGAFLFDTGYRYTNQGMEFQAPCNQGGELNAIGSAAECTQPATVNHRSWHPVMAPTGRTLAERGGASPLAWRVPWDNGDATNCTSAVGGSCVGRQTMYCSDCHGNNNSTTNGSAPDAGRPWGPHGSANNFILKGNYTRTTGSATPNDICFKCHSITAYATRSDVRTGFFTDKGDGHTVHADKIGSMRCSWCHVAIPHGWKNKALLVNLNDVGPEVGLAPGTSVTFTNNQGYTRGPYYLNAFARINTWKASGNWTDTDCNGGRDAMRTQCPNPN